MKHLDPTIIRQQVENLKIAFPDLADDDDTWQIALESETDVKEYLRTVERKREDTAALEEALSLTIDALRQRKTRFERREQAMRALLFAAMQWADLRKCELPEATLSIRDGIPKVMITDESQIPDEYMRVRKEPDKALIKEALNGFENVPGATMSNAEPVLAVRVK